MHNGHLGCTCFYPLLPFDQFGDRECMLKPLFARDSGRNVRLYIRVTPPTDEYRGIRKAEAEIHSNDGAIWITSPR